MDQREITGPQTEIMLSLHSLGISWHIKCTCTVTVFYDYITTNCVHSSNQ